MIVPSTAGYPYPVPPQFDHVQYPFVGGMTRIGIVQDYNKRYVAREEWTTYIRSSAVPRYSFKDGLIYTLQRNTPGQNETDPASRAATLEDTFLFSAIEIELGELVFEVPITPRTQHAESEATPADLNGLGNPLQMVGCISIDSSDRPVFWQGTMAGYYRISYSG